MVYGTFPNRNRSTAHKPIAMADGGVVVVETFGAVGSGSSTQPPVLVRVQTKLSKDTSGTLSRSPRCLKGE